VGTVVESRPGNPFRQIRIRPAARLERLEEVIVLLSLHPLDLRKSSDTYGQQGPAATAAGSVTEERGAVRP
jgi:hypothetical protein